MRRNRRPQYQPQPQQPPLIPQMPIIIDDGPTSNNRRIPPKPGSMSVLARLGLPTNTTGIHDAINNNTSSNGTGGRPNRGGGNSTDKDGDLMMGGTSTTSSKRFAPYGKRGIHRPNRPPTIQVASGSPVAVAVNVPLNVAEESFLNFIRNKAQAEVVISDIRHEGKTMYFNVRNSSEFDTLKCLNGIRFGGEKLIFKQGDFINPKTTGQSQTGQHIAILAQVVLSRYNQELQFLDLSSIDTDPVIIQAGLAEQRAESSKIWPVICKLIGETCPQVQAISFASNKFRTLDAVSKLTEFVPNVTALSFENNPLDKYRDLEPLKGAELKSLREVVFLNTPLRTRDLADTGSDLRYRGKITAIFPTLTMLDQQPILPSITFAAPDTTATQLPIKPSWFDTESTKQAAEHFIQSFYNLYDNNRQGLIDLYDDNAAFSYSLDDFVDDSLQQRKRPESWPGWTTRHSGHRNLCTLKDPEKRVNAIHFGAASIILVLAELPQTKHDPTKWLIDAFLTANPVMLFLTVHGQVEEVSGRWKKNSSYRNFDRSFVIIPAIPGSRAAAAGLPYVIMNDQWTIRAWRQ